MASEKNDDIDIKNVEGLQYLTTVADNSIDLILTDPPYIISRESGMNTHYNKVKANEENKVEFMKTEEEWETYKEENNIADDEHAELLKAVDDLAELSRGAFEGDGAAEILHLGGIGIEELVEHFRRAQDDCADVAHLAAHTRDGGDIVTDVTGDLVGLILVFAAHAVEVWTDAFDGFDGSGEGDDDDVVHALQRGEPAGAKLVVKIGPAVALVDVLLASDAHH